MFLEVVVCLTWLSARSDQILASSSKSCIQWHFNLQGNKCNPFSSSRILIVAVLSCTQKKFKIKTNICLDNYFEIIMRFVEEADWNREQWNEELKLRRLSRKCETPSWVLNFVCKRPENSSSSSLPSPDAQLLKTKSITSLLTITRSKRPRSSTKNTQIVLSHLISHYSHILYSLISVLFRDGKLSNTSSIFYFH